MPCSIYLTNAAKLLLRGIDFIGQMVKNKP